MATGGFGFASRSDYLDRAVDGFKNLKFWAAVGVILGPVLAMFISHVFSAFLARQGELHERPAAVSR